LLSDCSVIRPANRTQFFGLSQNIQIEFDSENGDVLWYHIGAQPQNETELKAEGTQRTVSPASAVVQGTARVYVSVYVEGEGEPYYSVWEFVQEELPAPTVSPSGNPTVRKFSTPLNISVNAAAGINALQLLCGFEIYYTHTTDRSIPPNDPINPATNRPDASATRLAVNSNGTLPIPLEASAVLHTIKFQLWADDRLPSPVQTHLYQQVASGTNAYFFDDSGDGLIDRVVINTSIEVASAPERVRLISPFAATDVKDITSGINRINSTTIEITAPVGGSIFTPPTYIREIRTGFTPNPKPSLGQFFGNEYDEDNLFSIGDSIAPIAIFARYDFGQIDEGHYRQTGEIVRGNDVMTVTFSEPTDILRTSGTNIFHFYIKGDEHEDIRRFALDLEFIDQPSPIEARFKVLSGENIQKPRFEDSLSVAGGAIRESENNMVERLNETRRVPFDVSAPTYLLILTPISSFVKGFEPFDREVKLGETLPVALADFLVRISDEDMNDINIRGRMIDPLGNTIAEFNGLETNRNNLRNSNIFAHLLPTGETTRILVEWNAQNQAGRRVGAGIYLAIFDITGPGGKNHSFTVQIPVGTVGR